MNTLTRYLELIVDPTFDEFHAKRDSIRLAFLTSVAIYHAIDRVIRKTFAHTEFFLSLDPERTQRR
jgi:hypothetical protein